MPTAVNVGALIAIIETWPGESSALRAPRCSSSSPRDASSGALRALGTVDCIFVARGMYDQFLGRWLASSFASLWLMPVTIGLEIGQRATG